MLARTIKLGTVATTFAFAGLLTFNAITYAQGPVNGEPQQRPATVQQVNNEAANRGGGQSNWLTTEEKHALVATVLGMTVDELTAAKEAGQSFTEIVAAQGMTIDEFKAAKQAALIAAANQAVVDGELTQEEADAIIERIENGGKDGHGNGGRASWLTDEEKQALVAGVLGMSVEDLAAAKEAGQKLSEIVEAQGMTMEAFKAAKQTALIASVNQAVVDGELTQEEADAAIERIENGHDKGQSDHGKGEHRGLSGWLTSEEKDALVADVLGMTVEEITAAKEAGQKLSEIIQAQGMTMESFKADLEIALLAAVDQAVADGELTQDEADIIIERIENGKRGHRGQNGDDEAINDTPGTEGSLAEEDDGEVQALSIFSLATTVQQSVQIYMPIIIH